MNTRPMVVLSAVVVVGMVVAGTWAWLQLPPEAQVPIHWGVSGEADDFADKTVGLFLLPLITAGVAALMVAIPHIEPRRANLARSGKAFGAIWIGVMLLLGAIQLLVVAAALGSTLDTTRIVLVGTGALFIAIGNYLPKVRPNYMVGIRTPWTLTSERSWARTHRVGGRLFVIGGLVMLVLGLVGASPEALFFIVMAEVVVFLSVAFVYSYTVWKADPDKRAA